MRNACLAISIVGLLLFSACAPTTPPPDPKATEAAMLANILATLTASAPTVTQTPTETLTPTPTSTPTPTLTPANTPTATPTPTRMYTATATRTATPTGEPLLLPADWTIYEGITGRFRLAIPPNWESDDESTSHVGFTLRPYAWFVAGVSQPECGIDSGVDLKLLDSCLVETARGRYTSDSFKLVEANVVRLGGFDWFSVEYLGYDRAYEVWSYTVKLYRADQDSGLMVFCSYGRAGTKTISSGERDTVRLVSASFRTGNAKIPR